MKEWRGAPVVEHIKEEAKAQIESLAQLGITPTLGILRVGAKDDDLAYERGIVKRFGAVGAKVQVTELPESVSQEELEATLDGLNKDKAVHGILIFNPLPKHLDEKKLLIRVRPDQLAADMDGQNYAEVLEQWKSTIPIVESQTLRKSTKNASSVIPAMQKVSSLHQGQRYALWHSPP